MHRIKMSPTTMPDRARLTSELAGSELSSNFVYDPLPKASPMAWVVVSVLLRSCSSRTIEPDLASCSLMNSAAGLRRASCLTTVAPIVAAAATQTAWASSVGAVPASSIAKVVVGGWFGLGGGSTTARPAHWAHGWRRVRCNGEQATSRIVLCLSNKDAADHQNNRVHRPPSTLTITPVPDLAHAL